MTNRSLSWITVSVGLAGLAWTNPLAMSASKDTSPLPPINRGPYLQLVTSESLYIVWRTEWERIEPVVRFGTTPDKLDRVAKGWSITTKGSLGKTNDTDPRVVALRTARNQRLPKLHSAPAGTFQYEARLTKLEPNTRYYYAVFDGEKRLTPVDESYQFETYPATGEKTSLRFWVAGDTGTARKPQYMVMQSALNFAAREKRPFDFFMHVGDIAYLAGTEQQFQTRNFRPFDPMLRTLVCWPTMSNHDGASAKSGTGDGPYFDAYVLPTKGEAGGAPSNLEAVYAFDYGRAHFICLDSFHLSKKTNEVMATWLKKDLKKAKDDRKTDWIIAFFHHPAYTKGSHDGTREKEPLEMRQWIQPILEAGGVDVVFNGHSHTYERTKLIDGCYGTNQTGDGFVLDDGDGNPFGDGPYRKSAGINAREGLVTCVTGHGGMSLGRVGSLPMAVTVASEYGSTIVDIEGDTLTATMINQYGDKMDCFQIVKRGKVTPVKQPHPWELTAFPPSIPRPPTNAPPPRPDGRRDESRSDSSTDSAAGSDDTTTDDSQDSASDSGASGRGSGRRGGFAGFGVRGGGGRGGGPGGGSTNPPVARPVWTDALGDLPVDYRVIIPPQAEWQFLAGTHPRGWDWKWPGFDAKGWKTGKAAFGYKYTNNVLTPLSNMRSNYSVVYLRKEFVIDRPDRITELGLMIDYDDGFVAYLNGREVERKSIDRGSGLRAQGVKAHDGKGYSFHNISASALQRGTNVFAIEGHNQALDSSDFLLDLYLVSEE
jgi:acid phosphatase type 7